MATGIIGALKSNADVWAVLSSNLTITVESTDALVKKVKAKAKAGVKTAKVLDSLKGEQTMALRPIDFLRKIGTLTVPARHSMAQLSSSWAAIRYCWSIEPAADKKETPFRLSADARSLDFHQKTLLSDEFGIGFAGLIVERLLAAPNWIDTSAVLTNTNPKKLSGHLKTRRQPDYVMWGKGTPYFIVECKGCQSSNSQSVTQLASGLGQVISLNLKGGTRDVTKIVVATKMLRRSTSVLVIDPEDANENEAEGGPVARQVEPKKWIIDNDKEFAQLIWTGHEAQLLRFVGQYAEADKKALKLPKRPDLKSHFMRREDEQVTKKEFNGETFVGYSSPVLPEIGGNWPTLFRGINAELYESVMSGQDPQAVAESPRITQWEKHKQQPNISIGADGTCFSIEF